MIPREKCPNDSVIGTAPVGAGLPAKQALRCMAPALPVFAGKPAPTGDSVNPQNAKKPRQVGAFGFSAKAYWLTVLPATTASVLPLSSTSDL
ncbi:hypothetical protein EJA05_00485 [Pseudomonas oryziphila]|uniref:Uncharacterized protein n=2 Tax=Pseudomonas TaxID=286 RepID=A0ABM7CJR8_9PSED|nr:hypothetical protein EJA05_00485 [Pseudomonas oryziphila]AZL71651.1 hypothetical protein EI693_00460 [Pseudomonas oryziphila]